MFCATVLNAISALILLTYNALMHFRDQEDANCAPGAAAPLARRTTALLVIDLPNAGPVFASEDTDAMTLERSFHR